jgi:hypothetical protein
VRVLLESEALSVIYRYYPDKHIYADDKPYQTLGANYLSIRSFIKERGFTSVTEWLKQKGIYIDMERDMHVISDSMSLTDDVENLARVVFKTQAILGNAILSPDIRSQLMKKANEIFERIIDRSGIPTNEEQEILVLGTLQLLKDWNRNDCDDEQSAFWPYIYLRFGYKPNNDPGLTQYIYGVFCNVIKSVIKKHCRFFAPEGTQRYYTTMMLHALAPVHSIENLFEILLYFYSQDLEYRYAPKDPGFSSLVKCIAAKWDKDIEKDDEELRLHSANLASGLRILFSERPRFMIQLCEQIVCKMDALIRNQAEGLLSENIYIDQLLMRWYQKKSSAVRIKLLSERKGMHSERVIVTSDSTRIQYAIENGKVVLMVPRIRLEETGRTFPFLRIYQMGIEMACIEMEVFGSRLCWTTQRISIPLADYGIDFDLLSDIHLVAYYGDECILDTDDKLHRNFLIFDGNGHEIPLQSIGKGQIYLFSGNKLPIEISEYVPCRQLDHPGQLYDIQANGSGGICVNGMEIYSPIDKRKQFRHYASISKAAGACALYMGLQLSIYPEAFQLLMELPQEKSSLNFHISIDGNRQPLVNLCSECNCSFSLDVPSSPNKIHLIQVIDFVSEKVIFEYRYVILPSFSYTYDDILYCNNGKPVDIAVQHGDQLYTERVMLDEQSNAVIVHPDGLDFDLMLDVPVVRCSFMDEDAFSDRGMLWYRDIPKSAFISASFPSNWMCHAVIGSKSIPPTPDGLSYEIGNFLQTYKTEDAKQSMGLLLRDDKGNMRQLIIREIAFREHFYKAPFTIEDGKLLWKIEGNFIGDADSRFSVELYEHDRNKQFAIYTLLNKDEIVERNFPFEFGEFPYRVSVLKTSLFSKSKAELIYDGKLVLGDPNQWRFVNKRIALTKARCWVLELNSYQNVMLLDVAGHLSNFRYLGMRCPNGENEVLPEYEASLSYIDRTSLRCCAFNSDENSNEYEWINPVHIWPVSDSLLILLAASEEAVYVDKQFRTIANRTPELYLSHDQQKMRLQIPDYFEYDLETVEENKSDV